MGKSSNSDNPLTKLENAINEFLSSGSLKAAVFRANDIFSFALYNVILIQTLFYTAWSMQCFHLFLVESALFTITWFYTNILHN